MAYDNTNRKKYKELPAGQSDKLNLDRFPNFHRSGSVKVMRKKYYGKDALLLRCGNYIYNCSSEPEFFNKL